ncbi:MAG: zinc transporter ZupT [Dehalococcoidia bacterium]
MQLNVSFALLLATLAGLSTAIGGAIAIFMCRPKCSHLALILGFSAGVMLYISFAELLGTAIEQVGLITANIAFFAGIAAIGILDLLVPHEYKEEHVEDSHPSLAARMVSDQENVSQSGSATKRSSILMRVGVLTALGMAIHNFPEGLVVFSSAVGGDMQLGIIVAIAVALHNIPEGISIFVPIFQGSGSRRRAFFYSFLAGVAEPIGALLAYAILLPFLTPTVVSGMLAFAGGVMVYISLDELLPAAHRYGEAHLAIVGVGAGMAVMAVTLIVLG